MSLSPALLPEIFQAIDTIIASNAEEVTALDQAIGDGDHVFNLQRGLHALIPSGESLTALDWSAAFQKIGMSVMSTIGGASGSLYGTLFISMSKAARDQSMSQQTFAEIFQAGVEAVKQRGKADVGEKTMLDVLIPVALYLHQASHDAVDIKQALAEAVTVAKQGAEATRDMLATKGRASFLGERSRGHIDAGAKTSQLMITAITGVLAKHLAA